MTATVRDRPGSNMASAITAKGKSDAALVAVNLQHDDDDFLVIRNDLTGVGEVFAPVHISNMGEPFNAGFQFNESTVFGHACYYAADHGTYWVPNVCTLPWIALQLLHTEPEALHFMVDLKNLDADSVADFENLVRMLEPLVAHIGNVQQAIEAAKIDEGAVSLDAFHYAIDNLTFAQGIEHIRWLLVAHWVKTGPAGKLPITMWLSDAGTGKNQVVAPGHRLEYSH